MWWPRRAWAACFVAQQQGNVCAAVRAEDSALHGSGPSIPAMHCPESLLRPDAQLTDFSRECAGQRGPECSFGAAALQDDIQLSRADFLRRFGQEPDPTHVQRSALVIVAHMHVRQGVREGGASAAATRAV